MTDLEKEWGDAVAAAAKSLWGVELNDRHRPFVEPPQDARFGDATSGVPMRLARDLRKPPKAIAEELARKLAGVPHAARVEAAGGYVNFTADAAFHGGLIRSIRGAPSEWGRSTLGQGIRALVEHTSANPTGPMHIAHGRQAAVGDSLANVMALAGFDVAREFYVNDTGGQIENLGRSIFWRYAERTDLTFKTERRGEEAWIVGTVGGRRFELPEKNAYKGDYIRELAGELYEKLGQALLSLPEPVAVEKCATHGKDRLLAEIKEDLHRFRVRFDSFASEEALRKSGKVEAMLELFRSRGLAYEKDGALWLKTKDHGDEKDRPLVKENGEYVYRTPDLAYHRDKFERGFDFLIDTWGPDHLAEVTNRAIGLRLLDFRLVPCDRFLGARRADPAARCFEVLIIQHCRLLKNGQEVKMGKRLASYVTLRELMDEVGVDAARWFLAMRKTDSPLDFDLDVAKKQTLDNPVYYAQYAHARICSIYKKAVEKGLLDAKELHEGVWCGDFDHAQLGPEELGLLRAVRTWPRTVQRAAELLDPSLVCIYLTALSSAFQAYYQPGMRDASKRVIDEAVPEPKRRARLAACAAVQVTLRNGFKLLGVSGPERLEAPDPH